MASIPLPALAVQPPPSATDQVAKLLTIRQLLGQQQTQQLQQQGMAQENQQRALALQDQQTMRSLAPKYVTKDANGNSTGFDYQGFLNGAAGAGVSANTTTALAKNVADLQNVLATKQKTELENIGTLNDKARGHLEALRTTTDPTKRQAALDQALGFMKQNNLDASNIPTDASKIGNSDLDYYEAHLALGDQLVKEAQEKATAAESTSKQKQADVETSLKQVTLDRIKTSQPRAFDSEIDKLAPPLGPDGKPGPLASFNGPLKTAVNGALSRGDYETATKILTDGYNQIGDINKETNPQVIAARGQIAAATAVASENARLQFGNDKDARDKIESTVLKPYQEKMSEIGELQSAIGQAQAGNIAAARATLYKVIGVAQPQGTHRVAPTEVSGFSGMGSIPERIRGSIANALSGDPWTPQMVQDIKDFGTAQANVAQDNLNRGIDNTNKLYKSNVGEGLKKTTNTAPTPPAGKTTVYDPNGTAHFVLSGKLKDFLADQQYKGWHQ